ncbi:flagellin [uncultured Umboniibacter sp.]|uniref:flagellin N-terminal helical domain-containing protein n=1 Tax=uncultured Umboniibacter sp. TaxID=1798917 RepID=UPI00260501E3|nr:flagellin [uncultured Umboniibacter sp.]
MSLSLHTNFASLLTQNTVAKSNNMMTQTMQRLSTGFRINSAADDAAGLQIANRLESQARGLSVAQRNSQDAVSLLQTAEGALNELNDIGLRMKDLATQSANGTNSQAERDAMDEEFQDLASEFEAITKNTAYGGAKIFDDGGNAFFDNASNPLQIQVGTSGSSADQLTADFSSNVDALKSVYSSSAGNKVVSTAAVTVDIDGSGTGTATTTIAAYSDITDRIRSEDNGTTIEYRSASGDWVDVSTAFSGTDGTQFGVVGGDVEYNATNGEWGAGNTAEVTALGAVGTGVWTGSGALVSGDAGKISDLTSARGAIDTMSTVLETVSSFQSDIGSKINRLGYTMSNLANQETNIETSRGRIMDADFAKESANLTKYQLLMQAGTSMLGQTGQSSQLALSLLR